MAATGDSSSSSDDETLRRCQEAVWETRKDQTKGGDTDVQQSKRIAVAQHEHDGNELQVTQGFRTHVAKKLGNLLDSWITENPVETSSCVESVECDDDEGFRLFSTSVPGQTPDDPPVPVRRRPLPSSSDSDSEMESRLREAAVSIKDLLHATPSAVPLCSETVKQEKKLSDGKEGDAVKNKKKKKKKKKQIPEGSDSSLSNGEKAKSAGEQVKVKRKKKQKAEEKTTD